MILLDRLRANPAQNFGKTKPAFEDLADYRRKVGEIYTHIRQGESSSPERWGRFRRERDGLFANHPQSALTEEQKLSFSGLDYFPYDPDLRFNLAVDTNVDPEDFDVYLEDEGLMHMHRFGKIHFQVEKRSVSLSLFWIKGYGGGIFLPFRDQTNQVETYGGGRYLIDTIKQVDLGQDGNRLVIDFNFAYNPSCAYNPMWHCPLAPPENWLPVPIRAGEKKFPYNG